MPIYSRVKGLEMKYHAMLRGNEKRDIFINDSDKKRFLDILIRMKDKYNLSF